MMPTLIFPLGLLGGIVLVICNERFSAGPNLSSKNVRVIEKSSGKTRPPPNPRENSNNSMTLLTSFVSDRKLSDFLSLEWTYAGTLEGTCRFRGSFGLVEGQ